ncbi:hypothetical protein ABTZ03_30910 [Kitasatospora sp. NPDC096077]|uniref:hypothetical protein n=1 Tax=Kitasatospora sp. NPDC096077 TaxID=3155544 RepID=UPI00332C5F2D
MSTDTHPGPAPAAAGPAAAAAPVRLTKTPEPAADPDPQTTATAGKNDADSGETEAKPNPIAAFASGTAKRTGEGARLIGQWLGHWASTADQSGDEIRRRIVAAQLEAYTERRTEVEDALGKETKRIVRLEEEAADGGLTQAQRSQLTLGREAARRLEKTLKDMRKADFRPVQPTERQIARARSFGRLRRGGALLGAAGGAAAGVVNAPPAGIVGLLAAMGLSWWTAAHPPRLTHRPVPAELLLPELDPPAKSQAVEVRADAPGEESEALFPGDTGKPFPIRDADDDPRLAAASILRALLDEGLAVGSVTDVTREKWGWKATAHLTKGKPSALVLRLPELDVALGVRTGGVMAQPQSAAAGSVVLRVLLGDPFDPMPAHPVHQPRSNSILKPAPLGPSMDASSTEVVLAGQNIMVIAVSGGGKSQIVRNLVDYITSCTDAIALDIDPTGRGFGPLRRLAAMRAYDEERIDEVLDWAIREAEIRTERMGDDVDNWQISDEDPAVFAVVDEHPQLTKEQKQKVIKLSRIGRKARVTVVLLSQDATSDVVGDAIADTFGIRIMLPSRKADVPLVVGSDTAISEGWMPHRLVPSPGDWDPADAGCFYLLAPGLRDPILRKATHLDAATATLRTQERLAAGDVTITPEPADSGDNEDLPPVLLAVRAAFEKHGDPDFLTTDQILGHVATTGDEWRQWDDSEPEYRRREFKKKVSRDFKKAGLPLLKTVRRFDLDSKNPPSGYSLSSVEEAFTTLPD